MTLRAALRKATADGWPGATDETLGDRLAPLVEEATGAAAASSAPVLAILARLRRWPDLSRDDRRATLAGLLRVQRALPDSRAAGPRVPKDPMGLESLPGVGPKLASALRSHGLLTLEDLAWWLPREYRDRRRVRLLSEVQEGEDAVVEAVVQSFREGRISRGRYMATARALAADGAGDRPLSLRWFHPVGGLRERLRPGTRVRVAGRLGFHEGTANILHPEVRGLDEPWPAIVARYREVSGVGPLRLARMCRLALERLGAAGRLRALPRELAPGGLPLVDALQWLHEPPQEAGDEEIAALCTGTSLAHRRVAFEELFWVQLWLLREHQAWRSQAAPTGLPAAGLDRERLRAVVEVEPTGAQWRVLEEIAGDLASGRPMLRLLQGEVGSGKTLVALGAALLVAEVGGQVAIMAPTELLAEQHFATFEPWCRRAGLRVALLTAAKSRAERSSLLPLLRAGHVDVVIGTHALLAEDVVFRSLALVVVDEQHRFGVEQRARLRDKGAVPHLLVMTATPIPRTMALTAFGELDVSVIDELPPGREPTQTYLFAGKGTLAAARAALCRRVRAGEQAFVVTPLVEASDAVDVTHVEQTAESLRALLPGIEVGVVHGRLAGAERDAVMREFRAGALRVLVATTIVEVGVDVPGATVMLVEHAERFGLAQVHQLRGRVGRGTRRGLCLVHTASGKGTEARERLEFFFDTLDGFRVADKDLELRGAGDLFGTRQSGAPKARFLGFAGEGITLLTEAREAAATLLARDPELQDHPECLAELERRGARGPVRGGESG